MLALPSLYPHPLPPCSEMIPLPGNPYANHFQGLKPSPVVAKGLLQCPSSYQPVTFPTHIYGQLLNDNIVRSCYGNRNTPLPFLHHQSTITSNCTNSKTVPSKHFEPGNMSSNHRSPLQYPNSSFQNALPSFAMFGDILSRSNISPLCQPKAGFEQMAKMRDHTNDNNQRVNNLENIAKITNHTNNSGQGMNSLQNPTVLHGHFVSDSAVKPVAGKSFRQPRLKRNRSEHSPLHSSPVATNEKDATILKTKRLRHSIASILNIQPGYDDHKIPCPPGALDNQDDEKGKKEGLADDIPDPSNNEEVTQGDIDILSCSEDGIGLQGEGLGITRELPDLSVDFRCDVVARLEDEEKWNLGDKGRLSGDTLVIAKHDANAMVHLDRPSSLQIKNGHLEILITNDDNSCFEKGDVFMPQGQSSSLDICDSKPEYQDNVQEMPLFNPERSDEGSQLIPSNTSTLPSFRRTEAPANVDHPMLPPIQTLCPTYQQANCSEKSAFKPIVKSWTQSRPCSDLPAPSRKQCKYNHLTKRIDHTVLEKQKSTQVNESEVYVFHSGSNGGQQDGHEDAAEVKTKVDAISMLRHRSSIYQRHGVNDSPSDSDISKLSEQLPSSLGAWLSWLRRRDGVTVASAVESPPSSRVPPPPRYHCDACNKTYSTFGGLSKHRQFHCVEHVKKEFACKVCNKAYSSLGALKMHIRTHTLPCKCHVCGKAFSRPWLLQGHVRTHTGEKPFRCSHCGRAFADRSNLRAHLQTHAEVKKYACTKCGKTFSRMSLLTKHSEGSCPANLRTSENSN